MSVKKELSSLIKKSLSLLDKENKFSDLNITIEIPTKKENGDYSTNVALTLTKVLHQNPLEIAEKIVNNIEKNDIIEEIKIAPPGFINFYLKKEYLLSYINKIIEEKEHYGKNKSGNNKKINIEFVSANPTGILHIGHARGATYGDNLARIMTANGYDVTKEYYINDAGNQMNNLGISIKERYKEICGLDYKIPENGYHGEEIITLAKRIYDIYGNSKLDEEIDFFKKEGLNTLLNQIKTDLDQYRVNFNIFTSEQSLYDKCLVDDVAAVHTLLDQDPCQLHGISPCAAVFEDAGIMDHAQIQTVCRIQGYVLRIQEVRKGFTCTGCLCIHVAEIPKAGIADMVIDTDGGDRRHEGILEFPHTFGVGYIHGYGEVKMLPHSIMLDLSCSIQEFHGRRKGFQENFNRFPFIHILYVIVDCQSGAHAVTIRSYMTDDTDGSGRIDHLMQTFTLLPQFIFHSYSSSFLRSCATTSSIRLDISTP